MSSLSVAPLDTKTSVSAEEKFGEFIAKITINNPVDILTKGEVGIKHEVVSSYQGFKMNSANVFFNPPNEVGIKYTVYSKPVVADIFKIETKLSCVMHIKIEPGSGNITSAINSAYVYSYPFFTIMPK